MCIFCKFGTLNYQPLYNHVKNMAKHHLKGNIYGSGLDKNPQNINRKGRPKNRFTKITEELKEQGFVGVVKEEYIEFIQLLLELPEEQIAKMAEDKEVPLIIRLTIAELTDPSSRGYTMKDLRDYVFGKSTEHKQIDMEIETTESNSIAGIDKSKLNEEQQHLLETILATE